MSAKKIPELWATVKGHENYEISTFGNVRRSKPGRNTVVGRPLKQHFDDYGYLRVGFSIPGNRVRFARIHRLVAIAFIRDMVAGEEVNHLDSDKTNNHVGNLEITDHTGNIRHRNATGRVKFCHGEAHPFATITDDEVREIRRLRETGLSFGKIAKRFGIYPGTAFSIVRRTSRRHVE